MFKQSWKFVKDSFALVFSPIKSYKRLSAERKLAEHNRRMATDPDYIDKMLDPKKPEPKLKGGLSIGNIMGVAMVIFIGASMVRPIASAVNEATNVSGITRPTAMAVETIPSVFTVMIIAVGGIMLFNAIRRIF